MELQSLRPRSNSATTLPLPIHETAEADATAINLNESAFSDEPQTDTGLCCFNDYQTEIIHKGVEIGVSLVGYGLQIGLGLLLMGGGAYAAYVGLDNQVEDDKHGPNSRSMAQLETLTMLATRYIPLIFIMLGSILTGFGLI